MKQSVQSLSHVRLFSTPWTAARQASLSITNSQSLVTLMSIESVMARSSVNTDNCGPISVVLHCVKVQASQAPRSQACCIFVKHWHGRQQRGGHDGTLECSSLPAGLPASCSPTSSCYKIGTQWGLLTSGVWVSSGAATFLGLGLKCHFFVFQISYKYLIIALGIQLDYEKVLKKKFFKIYFWLSWVFVAFAQTFSSCGEQRLLSSCSAWAFIAVASLIAEHGF